MKLSDHSKHSKITLFQREITLLTDENGFAQIDFTLGSRTGEGFHRVLATTPGSLTFAEFCATAETSPPFNISIVMNPTIQSVVGQPLTQPIGAYVTDDGGNPIIEVPVDFQIQLGGSNFGGESTTTVLTNADGIAETSWTLGPNPGTSNNEATATFTGHIGFPVTYITSGVAPGPVEATTVTGIVQDSLAAPIVGPRAILRGTGLEALTGEDGAFTITDVPPGGHHAGILGSAADDPGNNNFYPDIDFAIEVVSGVENPLDQIVVLPFLDMDNAQLVGGDEDVELLMADTEGFAIKVFANSTFIRDPDTGELVQQSLEMSSSQVKIDKIPMPPPQGATPLIVGTLQPAGVVFDPPAQVTYPNAEGFAPGDVADIFAFHHDIGQFVNIGPGTVTEDGDVITSDPGFGIVQSGWHCLIRIPGLLSQCTNINGCTISSITLTRTDVNMVSTNIDPGDPILLCINDQLEIDLEFEVEPPGDTTFGPGPQQFTEGWSFGGPLSLVESTEPFPKSFPSEETTAKIELQADNNGGSTQVTSPKFEFELKSTDDVISAASCAAQFDIDVVRADLDIDGVDEADEETKGGFVCLNTDDDNNNIMPEKEETGPGPVTVTGEDDLLPITINLVPENLKSGTLELEALQGGDKITVWTTPQKGTKFPLGEPLNANNLSLPLMLYIEGIKESDSEKDIELRLHYTNGPIDCDDKIKLTSVNVELSVALGDDDSNEISADFNVQFIGASVSVETDEEGNLIAADDGTKISWRVEGAGATLSETETTTLFGFSGNQVEIPTLAGSTFSVFAELTELVIDGSTIPCNSAEVNTGEYTVIPGEASMASLTSEQADLPSDGNTTTELSVSFTDSFGNSVLDGTPVIWELEGLGEYISTVDATVNGEATATLQSGELKNNPEITDVSIADTEASLTIPNLGVDIILSSSIW